jgi:hypothetical protein
MRFHTRNYLISKPQDMEHIYTAYTKTVQNIHYYFVKKIMTFPEYDGLAPVTVGYGMHTDFEKACSIAGITDVQVKKQLLQETEGKNTPVQIEETKPAIPVQTLSRRLAVQAVELLN